MNRLLLIVGASLAIAGCAKKHPTSRPVVVEDILPAGAPVCFPTGMTNASERPGAEVEPTMAPATQNESTQPTLTTVPATTTLTAWNHWCALCAAAAERAAEMGRDKSLELSPETDLLIDLPRR